jgi:hypothetical protein
MSAMFLLPVAGIGKTVLGDRRSIQQQQNIFIKFLENRSIFPKFKRGRTDNMVIS